MFNFISDQSMLPRLWWKYDEGAAKGTVIWKNPFEKEYVSSKVWLQPSSNNP